jgi:hypothetical protein
MIEHKKKYSNTMLERAYQTKIHKRVKDLVAKVHEFKNDKKNYTPQERLQRKSTPCENN